MICKKCGDKFANRVLVDGKVRVLNSRKYCLVCSPFGQHNTKADLECKPNDLKFCPKCKRDLPKGMYYSRRKNSVMSYCKECFNSYTVERQRQIKKKCVEYLGGKCCLCGYNKYFGALEFHHKDPTKKDPRIRFGSNRVNFEALRSELDKCILLCANCHREEHASLADRQQSSKLHQASSTLAGGICGRQLNHQH